MQIYGRNFRERINEKVLKKQMRYSHIILYTNHDKKDEKRSKNKENSGRNTKRID